LTDDWRSQVRWQALAAAQLSGSQDHDRAVLTLSSATLALSATFVHDIAPDPMRSSDLLVLSWVALIAAIIFMVISFQASQWAMQAAMLDDAAASRTRTRATVALNILADVGFVAGILFFALFARSNI